MDSDRDQPAPVPCLAHPSTGFVHPDGRCACFFGEPAPEFKQPERDAA